MIRRQKFFEDACLAAFEPPITISRPESQAAPVIFASPHSGSIYPSSFLARSDLPRETLRRNEDALIDILFASAVDHGAPLLTARFPRCFLDVNRAADELPQKWLPRGQTATPRAAIGLGVIPTMIGETLPIYSRPLRPSAVQDRLKALYYPYHDALRELLTETQTRFGRALLVDCHSMPGFAPMGARRSDVILGDRYGTSCHPETLKQIEDAFKSRGYTVTRNYPYAGSYVTSHYGQPHQSVEAIQIEINRDLYLNPATLKPKRGYEALARDIDGIISDIIQNARPQHILAAE